MHSLGVAYLVLFCGKNEGTAARETAPQIVLERPLQKESWGKVYIWVILGGRGSSTQSSAYFTEGFLSSHQELMSLMKRFRIFLVTKRCKDWDHAPVQDILAYQRTAAPLPRSTECLTAP